MPGLTPAISAIALTTRLPATRLRYAALARRSVSGVKSLLTASAAVRVVQRKAAQFLLDRLRALGNSCHSAESHPCCADPAGVDLQAKRRQHSGNILVETLGDLVGAKMRRLRQLGHQQPAHEFSGSAVLLAVVEEEVLQRKLADFIALA